MTEPVTDAETLREAAATRPPSAASARFRSLSLPDLLEARDAYHVHLINLRHVVATAVGRYLVRVEETAPSTVEDRLALTPGERPARTLANSTPRPWSWPCVLVFVGHWMTAEEIRRSPDDMVPRRLYMPDGRLVPTCVIYAPKAEPHDGPVPDAEQPLSFPTALMGGGYACLADAQGRERVGSIACLVSDGDTTYALTNRHVAGKPGRELYTLVGGTEVPMGRSAGRSVGRRPFGEVYPGYAGERVELAIDAGLVEIDDVGQWTTQIFGVGRMGEVIDVRPESLDVGLVGQRVQAFGAASGALEGEIAALYYRYATRSGVEYVADAIVGPATEEGANTTRPGDSGTLWLLASEDEEAAAAVPRARPLAMQWGGHRFESGGAAPPAPYALVTFLSTVCRALDVEPLRDWNDDHGLYWGEVGHYAIGARACDLVAPTALREYFVANRNRISFDLQDIADGTYDIDKNSIFFPLADVPDHVWKRREKGIGRPREGPNHFADMDEPRPSDGETLLSLFAHDPTSVSPQAWIDFYTAIAKTPRNMGLLPFRVAQLYQLMLDALRADSPTRALAAAGAMAHYVGDACQPLHASRLHDGRNEEEKGVHSAYETAMVTSRRALIIDGLDRELTNGTALALVSGAPAAALAVVELMQRVAQRLPPEEICDAYVRSHRARDLWEALGEQTIQCMAEGCRTLAMLWSSAWSEAGAAAPTASGADKARLRAMYSDPDFAPSLYLPELADVLAWP
jgi:hypothetical protein